MRKPFYKSKLYWGFVLFFLVVAPTVLLYGQLQLSQEQASVEPQTEQTEQVKETEAPVIQEKVEEPIERPVENESPTYMTSGEWALTTPYAFAVEVDGYGGDIYEAGIYNFDLLCGRFKAGECMPAFFGVYIADKDYQTVAQLTQDFAEATFYIGGISSTNQQYELQAGQYVFILPEQLALEPTGFLSFEKVK